MSFDFDGLAGAGFPPANTPSSACASCGKLCDHKNGMVPMEAMSVKLCSVCKSYTYIVCSKKCMKNDRKRHAPDCKGKLRHNAECEKRMEKEKSLRTMQMMRSDLAGAGDDPKFKEVNALLNGETAQNKIKKDLEDLSRLREENNTQSVQLRNRQLHHATQMYKQRHNLDDVGLPPHFSECRYCHKAARVNPKTFHTNMARCSKCLLVRCKYFAFE